MTEQAPYKIATRRSDAWAVVDVTAPNPETDNVSAVYAIGDVHGRLDLLLALEQRIREDIAETKPAAPAVCYLGDYIDRGPSSAQVIEHLASDSPGIWRRIFLKGNHEERMLEFLNDPAACGARWLEYGGREAFASYGLAVPTDVSQADWFALRDDLAAALPRKHLNFLKALTLTFRWGKYLLVHAGLNPNNALEAQNEHDLLWIRGPFLESDRDWGAIVVHGHVIVDEPQFQTNRIGIDTGAYRTGRLTCLVLTAGSPRLLTVDCT